MKKHILPSLVACAAALMPVFLQPAAASPDLTLPGRWTVEKANGRQRFA